MHQGAINCVCNEVTVCGANVLNMTAIIRIFVYFEQSPSKSGIINHMAKTGDSVLKPSHHFLQWLSMSYHPIDGYDDMI